MKIESMLYLCDQDSQVVGSLKYVCPCKKCHFIKDFWISFLTAKMCKLVKYIAFGITSDPL